MGFLNIISTTVLLYIVNEVVRVFFLFVIFYWETSFGFGGFKKNDFGTKHYTLMTFLLFLLI